MPRKRKALIALLAQAAIDRPPALDLSGGQVGELLDEVCRMDWLTELNLTRCHLSRLPEEIGNLTRLVRLRLSENQLATLPDTITRLTALRQLDLTLAGHELSASETVKQWMKNVPEVLWTDGKPPRWDVLRPAWPVPRHPNGWLERLRSALRLYDAALEMEDRGFGSNGKRAEADAVIGEIFGQVAELARVLPELYRDFQARRFHSTSCESEKSLDGNPFRLPTKADDDWREEHPQPRPHLFLTAEVVGERRCVLTVHRPSGEKTDVASREHGWLHVGNQPYAPDETYWADCAAWLYQAGRERFYLRIETYGFGATPGVEWLGSDDGGVTWAEQAGLTYGWMNENRANWFELDRLAPARDRPAGADLKRGMGSG